MCIRDRVGSGGGPQDQVADDLGGGTAGQDFSGLEVAAGITVDNAEYISCRRILR